MESPTLEKFPPRKIKFHRDNLRILEKDYLDEIKNNAPNCSVLFKHYSDINDSEIFDSPLLCVYLAKHKTTRNVYFRFACQICSFYRIEDERQYSDSRYSALAHLHMHFSYEGSGLYDLLSEGMLCYDTGKWYWCCAIPCSYFEGKKVETIFTFDPREDDYDIATSEPSYEQALISDVRFYNYNFACVFCGGEYGAPPTKELILAHLERCTKGKYNISAVVNAWKLGYRDPRK